MNAVTSYVALCEKTTESIAITLNIILTKLITKMTASVTSFLHSFPVQMF